MKTWIQTSDWLIDLNFSVLKNCIDFSYLLERLKKKTKEFLAIKKVPQKDHPFPLPLKWFKKCAQSMRFIFLENRKLKHLVGEIAFKIQKPKILYSFISLHTFFSSSTFFFWLIVVVIHWRSRYRRLSFAKCYIINTLLALQWMHTAGNGLNTFFFFFCF